MRQPAIAVVTRPTRLTGLLKRRATKGAARFLLSRVRVHEQVRRARATAGAARAVSQTALAAVEEAADFGEYEQEDVTYQENLSRLRRELDLGYPIITVDRDFLPNFDFGRCVLVVVIGQDGLVANAAKYVGDLPIVGINPDPKRNDGILLPFAVPEARSAVRRALADRARIRAVTLGQVDLNDGQRMLAFNDFFIGCRSHVSARYTLQVAGRAEVQSSSGLIVSTGAGSTGWLSSVFNMTQGIAHWMGADADAQLRLEWEERRIIWAVREPFKSKHSEAGLVIGVVEDEDELVVESLMPGDGVIFSDGTESDFLEFNSGTVARLSVSAQRAHLVVA